MNHFTKRQNENNFTPVTEPESEDESGSESISSSVYNDEDIDDGSNEPGCYSFLFPSRDQLSTEKHKLRILQDRLENANESTFALTKRLTIASAEKEGLAKSLNGIEQRHKQLISEISAKGLITEQELAKAKKTILLLTQKNTKHVSDLLEMKEVEQVVANSVAAERNAIMETIQDTESKAKDELIERVNLETILLGKLKAANLSIFSLSQQLHRESKRLTDLEETRATQMTSNAAEVAMTAEKDYLVTVITALKNRNKELLVEIKTTKDTAIAEKDEISLKLSKTIQKLCDEITSLTNENARNLAEIREKEGTEDDLIRIKKIVIKLNNEIHLLKSELDASNAKHKMDVSSLLETNLSLDKQKKKVANDLMSFTTQLINSLDK
jgi:hypothetical protein